MYVFRSYVFSQPTVLTKLLMSPRLVRALQALELSHVSKNLALDTGRMELKESLSKFELNFGLESRHVLASTINAT